MSEKITIICLNPKNYNITKKKEYKVEEVEERNFWVINDLGKKRRYSKSLFEELPPEIKKEKTAIFSITEDCFLIKGCSFGKEVKISSPSSVEGLDFSSTPNCSTEFVNGMNFFSDNLLKKINKFKNDVAQVFSLNEFLETKLLDEKKQEINIEHVSSIFKSFLLEKEAKRVASRSVCHFIASSTLDANQEKVEIMDEFWPLVAENLNKIHGNYEKNSIALMKRVRENPNSHNIVHNYLI